MVPGFIAPGSYVTRDDAALTSSSYTYHYTYSGHISKEQMNAFESAWPGYTENHEHSSVEKHQIQLMKYRLKFLQGKLPAEGDCIICLYNRFFN